jgi:lipase
VRLNVHQWGDPAAPPVVCLHGITAHGRRFRRLAEERLAGRFRVLAPDLRGHGRSGWEPPWSLAQQLEDVVESVEACGVERAAWIGHSYGGRLALELAAQRPGLVERAVLLDPAIRILPHVGYDFAELQRADTTFESHEEAIQARLAANFPPPREMLEEETAEHLFERENGRLQYRYCHSAAVVMYSDICTHPPAPETLEAPALLVYAFQFGLVRDEQIDAYGDRAEVLPVAGGHDVYWDAFEQTADAVERFLG